MKVFLFFQAFFISINFSFAQTQQAGITSSINNGKKIYTKNCLSCHQADGGGVPNMNPPLINTSYVTGDKTKLIQWVLQGSKQKIAIDGQNYSNNMAPQNYLTDRQIAEMLTYIKNSFGNKADGVLAAEVKAVRSGLKK